MCVALAYAGTYVFAFDFWRFLLNLESAFLGFLLICLANFVSLKKRIAKQILELEKVKERKKQRFSKFILGLNISTSLLRILAYVVFCAILWMLMSRNLFYLYGFVAGVLACLFGIVGLQILKSRKKN